MIHILEQATEGGTIDNLAWAIPTSIVGGLTVLSTIIAFIRPLIKKYLPKVDKLICAFCRIYTGKNEKNVKKNKKNSKTSI